MQNGTLDKKENLEEIYLIMAEFFKYPTEEFFQELKSGEVEKELQELVKRVGYSYPAITLANEMDNFMEMQQIYMRCFMGITKPYALPVESIYKIWTSDPTAELSIAKSKGYLYGDPALHIEHLFELFQLEIPDEYKKMPDHLTLMLELLGFLIKNSTDEQVKQYIHDHFDWLSDFRKALLEVENSNFYVKVTDILIEIINNEQKRLISVSLSTEKE